MQLRCPDDGAECGRQRGIYSISCGILGYCSAGGNYTMQLEILRRSW